MAKHLTLLKLEIKKAFLSIPKVLLGTFVFGALIILAGFTSNRLMADSHTEKQMDVALVLPSQTDSYTDLLFSYIQEIDTVKSLCTFIQMDLDTAYQKLEEQEIFAIIQIPDSFLDNMIAGRQMPVEVILTKGGAGTTSSFFRELLQAASDDLGACEAGIYAVGDTLLKFGYGKEAYALQDKLGEHYVSYALNRSIYFTELPVTAAGHISMLGFYICSGILMLLLLGGITCSDILRRDSDSFIAALRRRNISGFNHLTCKLAGISTVFYGIFIAIYGICRLVSIRFTILQDYLPHWGIKELLVLFLIIISIFTFVIFIFELCNNISTGAIALFLLSILFLFISGAIIPISLLPDGFHYISSILPTTYWLSALQHLYSGVVYISDIISVTAATLVLLLLSGITNRLRSKN